MKKVLLIALIAVGFVFTGCKKNASTFQGQVRYVDSTGAYIEGANALITIHPNDTSKAAEFTGTANAEGIYLLENISDGVRVVKAELEIDSTLSYVGVSGKYECKGKDFIAAPVDME